VDHEPGISREPVQYRMVNIGAIKASVKRDLEKLLNTRRQILIVPVEYKEVNSSVFIYGLQDFTSKNPKSPSAKLKLRQDVEKAVLLFEPRLKNVNVNLEIPTEKERNLRFRITGVLVIEPVKEPVIFDTYYDVNRSEFVISD